MRAVQVAGGLGWSALASVVVAVAQVLLLAVLARLLEPQVFGLMAMAIIAVRFAGFFSSFAQALIQKPELGDDDIAAAVVMAAGSGVVLWLALLAASPLFALWFDAPLLTPVLAAFGATLVTGALASVPHALLRRAGRFGAVSAIDCISYVAGYGAVGVAAAASGWGVWSLVAATLAQQLFAGAIGFALARHRWLRLPLRRRAFADLWRYGSRYSLLGLLEFLWANVESLLIGRVLGPAALGVFNRSLAVVSLPVEQAVGAVNKVMFPALASLGADRQRLADGFAVLLLATGVASMALACGVSAASADVVAIVLGARWAEAAPVLAVVALAIPAVFMYVVCGITLDSVAALTPKVKLQAWLLVVKIGVVGAMATSGLVAIAVAVVVCEGARLVFGLRLVAATLAMPPAACWRPVVAAAAVGLAVHVAVRAAGAVSAAADLTLGARFALESAVGVAVLLGASVLLLARLPSFASLARFASLRGWHARALAALRVAPARW